MATVYFDEATRIFSGGHAPAVDHVTLDIEDGEFLVLVGPSGCGKSTTLRMLAGLEPIDEGRILIDGHDQKGVRPRDRDVAMVFQSYALYPNMTAAENMAFALTNAKVASSEVKQRVAEAAKILELEQFLDRKPGALSGGQRQRVAMGRAIVRNPKVFCMDEPLSNLDAKLRVSTRSQIAGLQRRLGITTVYVTHDQVEAMTMGHRVAVLRDGRLQQVGTPEELYDRPVNTFVASFIGSPGDHPGGGDGARGVGRRARRAHTARPGDRRQGGEKVVVGLRPESWHLVDAGTDNGVDLKVELVEALGSESFIYGVPVGLAPEEGAPAPQRVTVHSDKRVRPDVGDVVRVVPEASEAHVFASTAETGSPRGEPVSGSGRCSEGTDEQGAERRDLVQLGVERDVPADVGPLRGGGGGHRAKGGLDGADDTGLGPDLNGLQVLRHDESPW